MRRFVKGDRVQYSAAAAQQFTFRRHRVGTVVGYGNRPGCIRVLLDGQKWAATWSEHFFDPAVEPTRPGPSVAEVKEAAIATARNGASKSWLATAHLMVGILAARGTPFTTDEVWEALAATDAETPEPRALGAVMADAARAGIIRPTGQYRPSTRRACHGRPVRVWVAG